MKRIKKHKKKPDRPETSRSTHHDTRAPDLTYFINDRVELLHQAFSVLKPKEIIAMAPDCVRNLPVDNLQELCLEELLGISSKRLCGILDGGPTPSNTDSSSNSDRQRDGDLDKISLESISSDEAALGPDTTCTKEKKRKRCKRRKSKKRKEKNKEKNVERGSPGEHTRTAERAGLTVLELLELQARARAIRAQLQAERKRNAPTATITGAQSGRNSDDDDIEIKEEPAVIVELSSSDDEKPNLRELQQQIKSSKPETESKPTQVIQKSTQTITKRNDLTIIVPKPPTTKKIKLNRQKSTVVNANEIVAQTETRPTCQITSISSQATHDNVKQVTCSSENTSAGHVKELKKSQDSKKKKNKGKKKKKKLIQKDIDAEGSDQDEISLQLSDSEKMDLFEDFDRRSSDDAAGTSSEDSANTSSDESNSDKPIKNIETQNKLKEPMNVEKQVDGNDRHYQTVKLTPEQPEVSNQKKSNLPCDMKDQSENINVDNMARPTEQSFSDKVFEEDATSAEKAANNNMENNEKADNDVHAIKPAQNKLFVQNKHCTETENIKKIIKDGQLKSSEECEEIQESKRTSDNSQKNTHNVCEETRVLKITGSEDSQEQANVVCEDSKELKVIVKDGDSQQKSPELKEMVHEEDSQKNSNYIRETKTAEDIRHEIALKTHSEQIAASEMVVKKQKKSKQKKSSKKNKKH